MYEILRRHVGVVTGESSPVAADVIVRQQERAGRDRYRIQGLAVSALNVVLVMIGLALIRRRPGVAELSC